MQPTIERISHRRIIALFAGLVVFLVMLLWNPFNLELNPNKVLAVAALMITWWVTSAVPMPVTALLPLILFPLMGVAKIDAVAAPYANPVIFLFMGGFMIGLAIKKWNLHKRIALSIVNVTGTSGNRIILGFIISTGFLSMWLSNTATTMMMFPIAMSLITVMEETENQKGNLQNFSVCMMLAIAYASNIGGIATIIGTPPNVAFTAFLKEHNNYTFQFSDWMLLCTPLAIILLGALYFVMKLLYPNRMKSDSAIKGVIHSELTKLGKVSKPEQRVLIIFSLTAFLWITKDLINGSQELFKLDDNIIALVGALLMFATPSGVKGDAALLTWKDSNEMAWGVLLLFGGGISLASQLEKAGLIEDLGRWIGNFATGGYLLILVVSLAAIFLSEVMSNVALVIVFAPVTASMAEQLNANPLQLGLAMTLSASCAFMLPMGTPPNAIVFGSGKLKLSHMTKTGFIMNIISAILISLFCWYLLPVFVRSI